MAPPVSNGAHASKATDTSVLGAGRGGGPERTSSHFGRPLLCAVLDVAALGDAPGVRAEALFRAGVDWIQLRDRAVPAETLARTADALLAARNSNINSNPNKAGRILINKRVDVALATGADGVHLGGDAMSPARAAELLPATALIGASFHSEGEIRQSLDAGLAYGHFAPIWDPRSKPAERPALGTDRLRTAAALGLPLIAQGGLDAARASEAIEAGAAGVAVTGLLTQSADPTGTAQALREALDRALVQDG